MKHDFLKKFDGTEKTPRTTQKQALEWLTSTWDQKKVSCIQSPVGSGKSAISRAIQIAEPTTAVITPSNMLINQYTDEYQSVNFLKGKTHYQCKWGVSCEDWNSVLEQPYCEGCPYQECKRRALWQQPTFFNPVSYYYLTRDPNFTPPRVLVIDEAHTLINMMLLLTGKRFRQSYYQFDDTCTSEVSLVAWLSDQLRKLRVLLGQYQKLNNDADKDKMEEISREIESISLVKKGMETDAHNYAIWIDEGTYRNRPERFLNVKPIRPPEFIVERFLQPSKIVLMSGTLLPSDIKDLTLDADYSYLDLDSEIPVENRPVYYRPAPFKMNSQADPSKVVAHIEKIVDENPGLNTIIHTTYSESEKLAKHFTRPILRNTAENKDEKLAKFKKHGGVFLAAGCAEGIDLKGDVCRVNIIPKLLCADFRDPVVKKRKSLEDGDEWYWLQALKQLIQQVGRSTRSKSDWSRTYILDPKLPWLIKKYRHKLPRSFTEQIVWSRS